MWLPKISSQNKNNSESNQLKISDVWILKQKVLKKTGTNFSTGLQVFNLFLNLVVPATFMWAIDMEDSCIYKENEARKKTPKRTLLLHGKEGRCVLICWVSEGCGKKRRNEIISHVFFAHQKILIWDKLFSKRLVWSKARDLVTKREYNYIVIHEEWNRGINMHPKIFYKTWVETFDRGWKNLFSVTPAVISCQQSIKLIEVLWIKSGL